VVEEIYLAMFGKMPDAKQMALGLEALRGNEEEFAKLAAEGKKRKDELDAYEKKLPAMLAQYEESLKVTPWTVLDPASFKGSGGTTFKKLPDLSLLAGGKSGYPETYTVTAHTDLKNITGIRLEVLADKSLPKNGPGRAPDGNFVLNDFKVVAVKKGSTDAGMPLPLIRPQAGFSQDGYPVANAIDNNPDTGWAISPQIGKSHTAIFEIKGKAGFDGGTTLTFTLLQRFNSKVHNIGRFRLSVTTQKGPLSLQTPPDAIAALLPIPVSQRTPQQTQAMMNYFRSQDQELQRLQRAVAEHAVPPNSRALGAQDLAWALINNPAFLFNH
jgi:hypothetical protein